LVLVYECGIVYIFKRVENSQLVKMMNQPKMTIQQKIASFTSIEQALEYFDIDIDFDRRFIDEFRTPLMKRFNGYLLIEKPDDWFSARRALKNAYCKVQRGRLDPNSRSACCGCTSCLRR